MYKKSVIPVQSCCFAHKTSCVLDVPVAVPVAELTVVPVHVPRNLCESQLNPVSPAFSAL